MRRKGDFSQDQTEKIQGRGKGGTKNINMVPVWVNSIADRPEERHIFAISVRKKEHIRRRRAIRTGG